MPGRAELAVDSGGRQLAEEVFVEVSLGIAAGEGELIDHRDGRDQKAGLLDHERGVFHEVAEIASFAELTQVGEDFVANDPEHFLATALGEVLPAEVLLVRAVKAGKRLAGMGA